MSTIKLLDCTLRDGGYINNWNFRRKEISAICNCLVEANMDIIEIGFLTDVPHTEDQSLYHSPENIEAACPEKGKAMLAAMIALGERELDPTNFPTASECNLDIVRITFHRNTEEVGKAIHYAKCLMSKGYKVCMQPVGTTSYTDKQLIELIEQINELKPFAFYLVDTLGILCKEELLRFIYLIDYNLDDGIKIGFHSHNNLQMSFANAQQIIEYQSHREFLVDCSIYGMGRGAGNLCTELIAQYNNDLGNSQYNMIPILDAIDNYIYPIYQSASWGYSAHYYIAATHRCHPNYASYLMNKQTLTMNQVNYLLKNIPYENKYIFDRTIIHNMYYDLQTKTIEENDEQYIRELSSRISGKNILVLAPGKTIYDCSEKIKAYISEYLPVIFSINACFDGYKSDFVFFSNMKRLYAYEPDTSVQAILTSNLPDITHTAIHVNYSRICGQNQKEADNSGVMLLRLLDLANVKKVTVAGFDGFGGTAKYADNTVELTKEEQAISQKNHDIAAQIKEIMADMDITFLTPSRYKNIIDNNGKHNEKL